MELQNAECANRRFLAEMFADDYFPDELVEEGRQILLRLCAAIEAQLPNSLAALYALTHAATEEFNALDEKLQAAGSEIETAARDCIGGDFAFIAEAYAFADADTEELIAPRDW